MPKVPKKKMEDNSDLKPIHMLLEESLLTEIAEFRFKQRFNTRVEAIKALLRAGLDSEKKGGKSKSSP